MHQINVCDKCLYVRVCESSKVNTGPMKPCLFYVCLRGNMTTFYELQGRPLVSFGRAKWGSQQRIFFFCFSFFSFILTSNKRALQKIHSSQRRGNIFFFLSVSNNSEDIFLFLFIAWYVYIYTICLFFIET